MAVVRLDTSAISDNTSFHAACKELMGFPEFYGMNWDAWIDCLTYLSRGGEGLSRFVLEPNEYLFIEIINAEAFQARLQELYTHFTACTAFVNLRHQQAGIPNRIALVLL